MTAETDDTPAVFTESDRQLLSEMVRLLRLVEPHMPTLARVEAWLDRNPAAKWRQRHAVPQDRQG